MKQYHVAPTDFMKDRPIEGIKTLRRIFNLGLREAKEQMDNLRPTGCSMLLTEEQKQQLIEGGFFIYGSTPKTVQVYIPESDLAGRKIEAIKKLRSCTGFGLKETKDIMDVMWSRNTPIDIGIVNEYTVVKLREHGFTVTGWITEVFRDNEDLFTI